MLPLAQLVLGWSLWVFLVSIWTKLVTFHSTPPPKKRVLSRFVILAYSLWWCLTHAQYLSMKSSIVLWITHQVSRRIHSRWRFYETILPQLWWAAALQEALANKVFISTTHKLLLDISLWITNRWNKLKDFRVIKQKDSSVSMVWFALKPNPWFNKPWGNHVLSYRWSNKPYSE